MNEIINTVIHGDALHWMYLMPSNSVDLIITSPPYNLKNSSGGGMQPAKCGRWKNAALKNGYTHHDDCMPHEVYVAWQRRCLTEMLRLIKNTGAIFYNHKWRVQNGLLQDRYDIVKNFPIRQILIWQRQGGINFNLGYFLPTYEVIYIIAKSDFRLIPKANKVGDVWAIPHERNNPHPAPFPLAIPERIIASTSAQLILDPFTGSGTTLVAAKKLNRNFIGVDNSLEYVTLAQKRLTEVTKV